MLVQRVHERIYRITNVFEAPGTAFHYLIKGERIALFDTGAAHSPREVLVPALAEIGLTLRDVDLILGTHGHLDHAGGNLEAKRLSGAPNYLHSGDLFMVQSTEAQEEFMSAPLRALEWPAEALAARKDYVMRLAGQPAGADGILSDGDVIDLGAGICLRVIHIPGHSPGSVAFYWESEGVLLTGDGMQAQGSRPGVLPLYFNAADYRRSATALAKLDLQMLCMAHAFVGGGVISDPTRRGSECQAFLTETMRVADTLHRSVSRALERMPGASKREVALSTLPELIFEVPLFLERQSGFPRAGGPTFVAHIDAALAGSYPG